MATWYTAETARDTADLWPDLQQISKETIEHLLAAARDQVLAYAPAITDDSPASVTVPDRYALAQLRQAANLYRAATVDGTGGIGDGESFVITPHPLDWHITNLLRPKRGRPRVR